MTFERKNLGNLGESLAEQFLKRKKHRILARNLKSSIGEIDLLTEHRGTIVIVEVKTKRGLLFGLPQEMVHYWKQKKLRNLARLVEQKYPDRNLRVDVVAINIEADPPTIEHLENVLI